MNKTFSRILACLLVLILAASALPPAAFATETDAEVAAVIAQLEAIDTLEQMQAKRSSYNVNSRSNTSTTDVSVLAAHEAARTGYETYVSEIFSARIAAQQAYDALTGEQKAQIDSALVEKLSNYLPTELVPLSATVTPAQNEYTFEAVQGNFGQAYEVSNYMVSGNIPQTFILVDTSNSETSWTPSGLYSYGESNYDVTYCCDVMTPLAPTTHYKRLNLEDSNYYSESASEHIRAILQYSYPYISLEEMKTNLKAGGLGAEFVDSLTRADIVAAVQMAVWTYANAADGASDGLGYFASIDVTRNIGVYFTPYHDYTNELWDWYPGKRMTSYDVRAEYRVNTLGYYLCTLPGVGPSDNQIVISDIEVTRAELLPGQDDTYSVGMYIYLNNGGSASDDLKVTVTSSHTGEDGSTVITEQNQQVVGGRTQLEMYVTAVSGDTIHVEVDGTQTLERGVYFYEPEGGRDVSQCLVGVAEGETRVHAEESFLFEENLNGMGLRIYKTAVGTGSPLSDIVFHVYRVEPGEGEVLNPTPTAEEIVKYQTEANLVTTLTTDVTGYAAAALEEGIYLVVEEHNAARVKAPVSPFYISLPMTGTSEAAEAVSILSVYPKNEPVEASEEPPVIPVVPNNVKGSFSIVKYDANHTETRLAGAEFAVYRAATTEDTETETILCDGIRYAVVPVAVNGEALVLTTDENGCAASPELTCGVYYLVETKAPDGYQLLQGAIRVTVVSSELTTAATVEIGNTPGHLLPETGGAGTAWFLVSGGVLCILAAVLLITKKRMAGR